MEWREWKVSISVVLFVKTTLKHWLPLHGLEVSQLSQISHTSGGIPYKNKYLPTPIYIYLYECVGTIYIW